MKEFFSNKYFLLTFAILSILLYEFTNRFISGGIITRTFLDNYISIIPIFVLPYLLGTILFLTLPFVMTIFGKKEVFYPYIFAIILAGIISNIIYVVYPTFVIRHELLSNDIFSNLINFVYSSDGAYNAAPSGHTFFSLINMFYFGKQFPRYKILFLIIAILIIASTVFTGQHYVSDIITGLIFGGMMIWGGNFVEKKLIFIK